MQVSAGLTQRMPYEEIIQKMYIGVALIDLH